MRRLADAGWRAALGTLLLFAVAACGTTAPGGRRNGVVLPAGFEAAVLKVIEAAAACDFQVAQAEVSGGRALFVLFDQWRDPQPESAVLVVVVEERAGTSELRVTVRSLADYGRQAPAFDGHGFPSCACCEAAAAGFDMAVFSPSRALAAGSRARSCLLAALAR